MSVVPRETNPGWIVILNGAPRSGKSSIAKAIADSSEEMWLNFGVDAFLGMTPERYRPGIGLRPGGERPDMEPLLPVLYGALFEAVTAQARLGLNVVVDVGIHDGYSRPLGILAQVAGRLRGLPVLFVGVRCPIETVMERRNAGSGERYVTGSLSDPPAPVRRWQEAVHVPGIYDMEVDTSVSSALDCAARILRRLEEPPPPDAMDRAAYSISLKN